MSFSIVQSTTATETAETTSLTLTWGSATTVGNLLVLSVAIRPAATITAQDNNGTSWTVVEASAQSGQQNAIVYLQNAASTTSVTVTTSTTCTIAIVGAEISGAAASGYDSAFEASNTASATSLTVTSANAPASSSEIAFSSFGVSVITQNATISAGWTLLTEALSNGSSRPTQAGLAYQVLSGVGTTVSSTASTTTSNFWSGVIVGFEAAAGTAIPLAGNTTSTTSASGSLSVAMNLSGSSTSVTTSSASLSLAIHLSGTIDSLTSLSGTLSFAGNTALAGNVLSTTTLQGSLTSTPYYPVPTPAKYNGAQNVVTYLFADLLTGTFLAELPLTQVTFSSVISAAGQFQGTLNIEDPRVAAIDWITATEPARTLIWVDVDGALVWGGILWNRRYDDVQHTVTLTGNDLWSYFNQRVQAADYSYTWMAPEDPMIIAQKVITDAIAVSGSGFSTGAVPFSVNTSAQALSVSAVSTTSTSFTATVGTIATVQPGETIRLEVTGCTNPTDGAYFITVSTSRDGTIGTSITYGIGTGVGSYSQNPGAFINLENENIYTTTSAYAAGASSIVYVVGFQAPSGLQSGDTITVTVNAAGTTFPTSASAYALQAGGTTLTSWVVMSYPSIQRQTVEMIVSQLQQMGYGVGFDFGVDVSYNSQGVPTAALNLSFPRRGRIAGTTGLVIDVHDATEFVYTEDGTQMGNQIYETSTSTGSITVINSWAPSLQGGYPLLERLISHPDINSTPNVQIVLEACAQSDLALFAYPVTIPEVTLPAFGDPTLGAYITGDDVRLIIPKEANGVSPNPRFPQGLDYYFRITEFDVTIADQGLSTVKLTLQVPPAYTPQQPPI